jgi:hypothetical protein
MVDSKLPKASMRHCPRPPILMAGSSPDHTNAYICASEVDGCSATSSRLRNRMGSRPVGSA